MNNNYNYKRLENKFLKMVDNILTSNSKFSDIVDLISIVDTYMSNDRRHLIFYYQTNLKFNTLINKKLTNMIPEIKKCLSKKINLRKIPSITFKYDCSYENAMSIEEKLNTLK